MKKMKKMMAAMLALVMCLAMLAGCGPKAPAADNEGNGDGTVETKVLKMGHVYGDTYAMNVAMQQMSDEVYEKTEGRYKIEVHANSALGGETDLIEGVRLGTVDMCFTATTPLANSVPSIAFLDMPFLVEDYDHADAAFYSGGEVAQYILGEIDATGVKALTLCENGFRQLVGNKPVEDMDDLKGLKIRVMENALHLELWNTMGASPTTMSASEAMTGLQQNTIDAVEMFHSAIITNGFGDLCNYYTKTNHIYTVGTLLLNNGVWAGMSAEDQQVFMDAAATMREYTNTNLREGDETYRDQLIEMVDGSYEIPAELLQEAVAPMYEKHSEYADIIAQIQALA